MNDAIEKVVQGTMSQAKDWLLGSLGQSLHWLAAWFLSTFGWGGLVAIVAGAVLLLSLSARAVKFFHSPKGMATSAALMLAGLAFMWWFRPEAASLEPGPSLADHRPVAKPAATPEPAPLPEPPLLASKFEPEPVATRQASKPLTPAFPPLVFDTPPVVAMPLLLSPVVIPNPRPAIVVPPKHNGQQHTAPRPRPVAVGVSHPVIPPGRPAMPLPGLAQHPAGGLNGPHALSSAERQALAFRQVDAVIGGMAHQATGGAGMHPMAGAGHMGGHMGGMGHAGPTGHHPGHH